MSKLTLTTALLVWGLLSAACALASNPEASVTLPDASVYSGELKDGLLSGRGRLQWPDGDVYQGEFSDGLLHGVGTITQADGDVYSGDFNRGQFTGTGDYSGSDGTYYSGGFLAYQFNGEGELTTPAGDVYRGDFKAGVMSGLGTFKGVDGSQYAGEFDDGQYQGFGVWKNKQWRYMGEFSMGYFHGFGERVDLKTDQVIESGQWQFGGLKKASLAVAKHRADKQRVEQALFDQSVILQQALEGLTAQNPQVTELYSVLVAGDGSQDVFNLETQTIVTLLEQQFGSKHHTLMLGNHPSTLTTQPLATGVTLPIALRGVSQVMDPENDILLLYLTSHGSRAHEFSLTSPGYDFLGLTADGLAEMINSLTVKHKVIMLSACFSGGFIEPLKAPEHLVITASRDDRSSFGCGDEDTMTYFGRAYFEQALPSAKGFIDSFNKASAMIKAWEAEQGFEHSEPQIFIGNDIQPMLDQFWQNQ